MSRELIIEKLRKIATLAERGVGGEKVNAKIQLEKLLEKHHISLDDLYVSEPRRTNAFVYYHKWQREILFDCYHRIMCIGSFDYYQNKRRKKIYFEMTSLQEADLRDMYAHYKKLYSKELKRLASAFMMKHHLYNHNQDDSNGESLSKEEIAAIVRMMQGIEPSDYVSRNRSLT